ncbi:hypothetical protein [Silvania hatchlandensis]|jgi:hypothetical protein|uniref:Uncharacterized protein n=1 Tax=Silvania hatchlandensis TaxID=2926469 RepID=A0A9J6QA02_9ENTR|nr:hypothetical protein [Silvania hatchlandensis]MCU6666098.1 hypothetical protein [Silvania hatchlandensis]
MPNDLDNVLNDIRRLRKEKNENESSLDQVEIDAKQQLLKDGKTRNTLTLSFLLGFFGMLIFSCLFVWLYNWSAINWGIKLKLAGITTGASEIHLLELEKILSIMIGALGTSLGFIIGYYFKDKK